MMLFFLFFFYKLKASGNPASSKPVDVFSQQHLLTSYFCYVLVILEIFQTLHQRRLQFIKDSADG